MESYDGYDRREKLYWMRFLDQEKEEIKAHDDAGQKKETFKPSRDLRDLMKDCLVLRVGMNEAYGCHRAMIQANLDALNGGNIEELEKNFYEKESSTLGSFVDGGSMSPYAWRSEVKNIFKDHLKGRQEIWQDSWDRYVEKANKPKSDEEQQDH